VFEPWDFSLPSGVVLDHVILEKEVEVTANTLDISFESVRERVDRAEITVIDRLKQFLGSLRE